ncbi:glycosyltransferase [Leptolyngbya sp. Heron Island J]|uniref:glycosyltransferase n=1 Tax=Leptolyngbya sp. Heron Island J TaxID=1385935 RepID=UPI0003B96514|nr:glycosyltransferase [Leptolyngbya sp. Heron Island J]ESA39150.1 glycosyltransferase [Leptolyngbya sp. Heron Island J]
MPYYQTFAGFQTVHREKPIRIAFLVNNFPMLSETFVLNQITGLLDRGHEVDIYTQNLHSWDTIHPDVSRYRLWERTYALHKVPEDHIWRLLQGLWLLIINFFKAPKLIARSLNMFAYGQQAMNLWLLYTAASLLQRPDNYDYDIIHCQFGTQSYRGMAFKQLLSPTPKLLIMFRGFDISHYVQQNGPNVYTRPFQHADYCLANCEFFRQRVINLGWPAEKIAVHFSGLDVGKFSLRLRQLDPGEPVHIATTGRLVEKKGIEYAIRAVASVAKHYPNLTYSIIGDGPLREALTAIIQELQAESYIHLLGWKNETEIIQLLDQCHLFIAPSITAADGNQDAPINVLKEAMAMGLPVISTHHGGIPELVEDGVSGYLVPERDVEALADRLNALLAHPEQWPAMGQAGRSFVEHHYNLDHLNDLLVQRYRALLVDHWQALSLKAVSSPDKSSEYLLSPLK